MNNYKEFHYCIYKECYESKPAIISIHDKPSTGFISSYLYTKDLVEFFNRRGSIRGIGKAGLAAYSPVIYFDFDDKPKEAEEFKNKLIEYKVKFNVYDSGSRSVHFHIARNSIPSVHLPHSDKVFMSGVAPAADDCIYQHGRIFRLPNTIHHATGNKKVLLYSQEGEPLRIDIVIPSTSPYVSSNTVEYKLFEDPFILRIVLGSDQGSRNKNLFILIKKLIENKYPKPFIETFIKEINKVNNPPLEDEEIDNILLHHI